MEILGYKAENYNDGNLELDHIVTSPEGDRFIGEAEGKDTSAINIDKFRQLAVNIQEDLQRDEVEKSRDWHFVRKRLSTHEAIRTSRTIYNQVYKYSKIVKLYSSEDHEIFSVSLNM